MERAGFLGIKDRPTTEDVEEERGEYVGVE
jgi:hypothetical protein